MRTYLFILGLIFSHILSAQGIADSVPDIDSNEDVVEQLYGDTVDSAPALDTIMEAIQPIPDIVPALKKAAEDSDEIASPIEEEIALTISQSDSTIVDEGIKNMPDDLAISHYISFWKIFWSIILCVIGYLLILLITRLIDNIAERSTNYRITLKGISPFVRILGWALIVFIIIVDIFQPPYQTIVAVTASAGIAIGFASQDILKNIFGGIMILLDRPFNVGDKIQVGDFYGEVVEIGIRSTRIVTKDDSLVSLPNSEVVSHSVSNSNNGEANCQVVAEIYLPIDVDTDRVRSIAIEAAQVSRFIYLNKPITVLFFNEIKEHRSYLKMRLKAYVSDIRNEFAFQSDMTEIVMKELLGQGVIKKEDL